jgi:hypothetical protein
VTEALRFHPSILDQSSANPHAPVPIARIIDKTDGDFGVLSPNLNIGMAEYSNANFISKGTARSTSYQYPTYLQLEFPIDTSPNGRQRRYARFRPGFGEQDYWVGVSSRMARFANAMVPPDTIDFGLDNKVHDDYGKKLFARAIGYSAGLIDYFFRGDIDFQTPFMQDYPSDNPPTTIPLSVANITPDEETGLGSLRLVLQYATQTNTNENFPPIAVSNEISQNVTRLHQSVSVPFNSLPFPTEIGPTCFPIQLFICSSSVSYNVLLVYRGPLGRENDAVIVSNCGLLLYRELWQFGERVRVDFNCGPM